MKNLKRRTIVLTVLLIIILTALIPTSKVFAGKFENTVTADEAEIVMSLMADKTVLKAGDVVTITLSVDKIPQFGIRSFGYRLIYDSSKLQYLEEEAEIGPVGKQITGTSPFERASVESEKEFENARTVTDGGYTGSGLRMTGVIEKIKFMVKEDVTIGKINMYIIEEAKGGFNTASAYEDDTTNPNAKFYVETNIDQLVVEDGKAPLKGDMDGNGRITPNDAFLINVAYEEDREPTKEELLRGDVDGNGRLTPNDAFLINVAYENDTEL